MPGIWGDIGVGPFMPRRGFLDSLRQQQGYAQSPSGPGPYAPQVQRQVPDLQPYAGPQPAIDMGYHLNSPSGPRGASMRDEPSFEDYQRPQVPGIGAVPDLQVPEIRPPSVPDALPPQQPAAQTPTSFADLMRNLSVALETQQGLDPARMGLQNTFGQMFGQQQPRTIQTTDPGAGYGQSPSGPTARLGSAQFPMSPQQAPRDLQPYSGAGSNVGSFRGVPAVTSGQVSGYMATPQAMSSPSAPWAQKPARTPKPMSPLYEGPPLSSPSNPNWKPPGG